MSINARIIYNPTIALKRPIAPRIFLRVSFDHLLRYAGVTGHFFLDTKLAGRQIRRFRRERIVFIRPVVGYFWRLISKQLYTRY